MTSDSLYKKNLAALGSMNPMLTELIESSKVPEDVEALPEDFLVKFKSITTPAYGNLQKTRETIKGILSEIPLERGQVTVIVGAGYGHMVQMALKKKKRHHIILLVEPNPYFVKETLSRFNLTKWIKDGTFLMTLSNEEVGLAISSIETFHVIERWSVLVDPYTSLLPLSYNDSVQKANEHINQARCNTGTVMGAGKRMAQNDVESLPYVLLDRGVKELEGMFKGRPAVLVGTGPSLTKNVWRLKEAQGKVVIVAVAQALRTLLAYDIRPDFVTTVDYGETNYSHFDGLMECRIPLICLNRTYAPILKQYRGMKFISTSHQPGFEDTTIGLLEEKGWLDSGGSVAHFNMSAAVFMGCEPLILIGQDLAWTDRTHAETLDESGKVTVENDGLLFWEVTDPRSKLKKEKKMCVGQAVYLPGYYGIPVVSNVGLASFLTSFEAMIKGLGKTVINSTEGGVNIQGTDRMSLSSALEKHCAKSFDKSLSLDYGLKDEDGIVKEAISRLYKDIDLCDVIIGEGKKARESNIKMEALAHKNVYPADEMQRLMKENEVSSTKAEEAAKRCPLVGVSILEASRKLYSQEMYVDKTKVKDLLKSKEDLLTRLKRNKMILEAAAETAEEVKGWCKKSLDLLVEYRDTKDTGLLTEDSGYSPNLNDAEDFFEVGNWATPLIEARNLMSHEKSWSKSTSNELKRAEYIIKESEKMREESILKWRKEPDMSDKIQYQALLDKAKELGTKENRFEEALDLLQKAVKIMPKEYPARWGLANALLILKRPKEAEKEYRSLMKDFPENVDVQFEYGCALLDLDIKKGVAQMVSAMQKTEKYDHMFIHIGRLYEKSEEFALAVEAYEKYLEKYPLDPVAKESLEQCKEKAKK